MKKILVIFALIIPLNLLGQTIVIQTAKTTDSLNLIQVDSLNIVRNVKINKVAPNTAKIGDIITLTGFGFGATQSGNNVYINEQTLSGIISWTDTLITIKVPIEAFSGNIYVKVNSRKSNELPFTLNIPDPIIYEIKPNKVFVGDTIKIRGLNFGKFPIKASLMFNNNVQDTIFISWKDTLITTKVPKYSRTGKIYADIQGKKSNSDDLYIKPFISSLSKNNFLIGELVSIIGNNFGDNKDSSKLTLNNFEILDILSWSDTTISLNVPRKVLSGKIALLINGLASNQFDYKILPNISSMTPDSVGVTDIVTFKGIGFGNDKSKGFVQFKDSIATGIKSWNDSLIVTQFPFLDSSGKASITVQGLKSNEKNYIVIPKILSITPDTTFVDDVIDIKGSLFGNTLGQINFGSVRVIMADSWQDNEIKGIKVPRGISTCNVTVQTNDHGNSHGYKVYISPKITDIAPGGAYINEIIKIRGMNFGTTQGISTVNFRSAVVNNVSSWSDTLISLLVPGSALTGKVNITVDGLKSNEWDFAVIPKISRVSTLNAPANYIDSVYGQKFGAVQGNSTLTINDQAVSTITYWSDGLIIFTVPSSTTSGPLKVTVESISSNAFNFTFNPINCVDADGNIYNSVQIGTQIWMRENLRVGTRINSTTTQTNNGIIEKYLYNNNDNFNITYGGLYQWNELMQYSTTPGARGLCPVGWHIPYDGDWNNLLNYIGATDQVTKLSPGGSSGFNAQFAGIFNGSTFNAIDYSGWYWTSSPLGYPAFVFRL